MADAETYDDAAAREPVDAAEHDGADADGGDPDALDHDGDAEDGAEGADAEGVEGAADSEKAGVSEEVSEIEDSLDPGTQPLRAEDVYPNTSVLARTADGLSYALTKFELHGAGITSVDALKTWTHLRYVNVSDNEIKNLKGIAQLPYLLSLDARQNVLRGLPKELEGKRYLQYLDVSENQLKRWNLTDAPLPDLIYLNVSKNQLAMMDVTTYAQLAILEIRGNRFSSLAGLAAPKLEKLYAAKNELESLSDLGAAPHLTVLHLRENAITSLAGLENAPKLARLNLRGNRINDVAALDALTALQEIKSITLDENPIQDSLENYRLEILSRALTLEKIDKDPVSFSELEEARLLKKEREESAKAAASAAAMAAIEAEAAAAAAAAYLQDNPEPVDTPEDEEE